MRSLTELTVEQIERLEAGRELDALTAQARGWFKEKNSAELYGWVWADEAGAEMYAFEDWRPSEDIACAWELAAEARLKLEPDGAAGWTAGAIVPDGTAVSSSAAAVCLAICRCYLQLKVGNL